MTRGDVTAIRDRCLVPAPVAHGLMTSDLLAAGRKPDHGASPDANRRGRARGSSAHRRHRTATDSGPDVLTRLRGDATRRPPVDPGLAGGLREWLEDGLAGVQIPGSNPVVVDRTVLTGHSGASAAPECCTVELARGAMVGALFRQITVAGRIGNPVGDALGALAVDAFGEEILSFVRRLSAPERRDLFREVWAHATLLRRRWRAVPRSWLPRTRDRITIPLAGGGIVLAGTLDLVLGGPSAGRASVCTVSVRSGERRSEHALDLHFYALLETLRSGAPPCRLATYYSATGEIDHEEVSEAVLGATVRRTIDRMQLLCRQGEAAVS